MFEGFYPHKKNIFLNSLIIVSEVSFILIFFLAKGSVGIRVLSVIGLVALLVFSFARNSIRWTRS